MKKTKRKILGFLGLILVVAMTIVAYFIPSPDAEAEEGTTSHTDQIVINVYDQNPNIVFNNPKNEQIIVGEDLKIEYDWMEAFSIDFEILYDDEVYASWTEELGEFEPTEYPTGSGFKDIVLSEYGPYILHATVNGPASIFEDSLEFYRLATSVEYLKDEENGNPDFRVYFDDMVNKVQLQVLDKNDRPIFADPIILDVSGYENYRDITLEMPEGTPEGEYTITSLAIDTIGRRVSDSSWTLFKYTPVPDIPDTGLFSVMKSIADIDILTTTLLVFFAAALVALFLVNRKKER